MFFSVGLQELAIIVVVVVTVFFLAGLILRLLRGVGR